MIERENPFLINRSLMIGKLAYSIYDLCREIYGDEYEKYYKHIVDQFVNMKKRVSLKRARELIIAHKETRELILLSYECFRLGYRKHAAGFFDEYKKRALRLKGAEKRIAYSNFLFRHGLPFFFCKNCGNEVLAARVLYGLIDIDERLREELGAGVYKLGGCVFRQSFYTCPICNAEFTLSSARS